MKIGLVRRLSLIVPFWILKKIQKKHFCCWQEDTIHAYKSYYLHCPSTKVPSKLIFIDENNNCILLVFFFILPSCLLIWFFNTDNPSLRNRPIFLYIRAWKDGDYFDTKIGVPNIVTLLGSFCKRDSGKYYII